MAAFKVTQIDPAHVPYDTTTISSQTIDNLGKRLDFTVADSRTLN